jgi:hypothetical protein
MAPCMRRICLSLKQGRRYHLMQSLRSISSLLAPLIAALICLPAAALDIKRVQIGKPLDCEYIRSLGGAEGGPCIDEGRPSTTMIWGTTLLGTRRDLVVSLDPVSHLVTEATVGEIEFDDMLTALSKKFGQPQCTATAMTNGMGAHFTQNRCMWRDSASVLMLSRNLVKLGDSQLILLSRKAIEESARERKKAANDL